jgi:protein-tyrosine-phosphatase/DNA-binding transcriptional ArsR family regulator
MFSVVAPTLESRAALHAALGDSIRLAIVDELTVTDRAPNELGRRFGLAPNLLAHHLDVLEAAGLIERFVSSGDRRRRYVRLVHARLGDLTHFRRPATGPVLFLCTHNSARSQLAAAVWRARVGDTATSAGTHPAARVHPGAVAAARRAGIDLGDALPEQFDPATHLAAAELVVTVCDRAHEEIDADPAWLHWSLPDPVASGRAAAFDATLADLDARISRVFAPTDRTAGVTK